MAHPVRLQMLSLLTGSSLTAADVARELGLTHANASYHLRNLLNAGLIRQAGEERIRGGVAKRYRYDADRDRERDRERGGSRTAGSGNPPVPTTTAPAQWADARHTVPVVPIRARAGRPARPRS